VSERTTRPHVSVIMAVRNEARSIRNAVSSVLDQDVDGIDLELLVVDGRSDDGSREVLQEIAATEPRLRVLDNPHRLTPHAFNIGLREATGEYVCIFGSHTSYDRDYVAVCLDELERHGAVGSSGRVLIEPADESVGAQLVVWMLNSSFASSGRSFRTAPEGFADSIAYPLFRKDALLELGGYNERLARNQDNDMNQRLRAAGHRLYLTWRTTSRYRAQPGPTALMRYAYRNGYWNYMTVAENPRAMRARHFTPLAFVAGVAGSMLGAGVAAATGRRRLASVFGRLAATGLGTHLATGAATGVVIALRERRPEPLLLPAPILGFHAAYGAGTLVALLRRASAGDLDPLET
jgi:succinoglycan biosynthesis protein ExoA